MLNCPVYWCSSVRPDELFFAPRAAPPSPVGPGGGGGAPLAAPVAVAIAVDDPDPEPDPEADAESFPDFCVPFLELLGAPVVDVDDVLP